MSQNAKQKLDKLREWSKNNERKTFTPFDWKSRTWKMKEDGEQRVRILPPKNENDLMFLADGFHIISQSYYQDCKDPGSCPVCKMLKRLWDSSDEVRKATYRTMKRKKRFTYQIILLNDDGSIKDRTPKLYTVPKKIHDKILGYVIDNDEDITDVDEGRDFVIVRKKGEFFDYSESYFVDETSAFDMDEIEELNDLTSGKYYNYSKSFSTLNKLNKQFDLGMSRFETTDEEEVDDEEKEIDDYINSL